MAETTPPPIEGIDPAFFTDWPDAMARLVMKSSVAKDMTEASRAWLGDKAGVLMGSLASYLNSRLRDLNIKYPGLYGDLVEGADKVIDFLVTEVSGLNIPDGTIGGALTSPNRFLAREALGNIFVTLLDETLQTEEARIGFANRTPGDAERANMANIVGAAFRMQIGDMVAGWIAGILPFGLGDGATQIAERIDKAINLDDAIEEIIQVPMEATITRGLTEYYNRLLKPQDYTESEARQLFLRDKITPDIYNKVLDNQGLKDDTRANLLDLAAPNLTESDIDQLYQHNLLDREEVMEQYHQKGFTLEDRVYKTKLVEGTRRWKLEEKVFELYGNLYRDGVATKAEVSPFLKHFGYDQDEEDMWFQAQELERRQRKWISDSNLIKLILNGEKTTTEAISYLTLQGMEVNDAASLITLAVKEEKKAKAERVEREVKAVIAKLPKPVKDKCDDLFDPQKLLTGLLNEVIAMIPLGDIPFAHLLDLQLIIECALKELGLQPPPTP